MNAVYTRFMPNPNPKTENLVRQKPGWEHLPTKAIRVPEVFADSLLAIARDLDTGEISLEDIQKSIEICQKLRHEPQTRGFLREIQDEVFTSELSGANLSDAGEAEKARFGDNIGIFELRKRVKASSQGVERAEKALIRLGFESNINFTKSQLLARSTVTKFFQRQPIQLNNFKKICEKLQLDWREIAGISEEKQSEQLKKDDCSSLDTNEGVEQVQTLCRQVTVIDKQSKTIKAVIVLKGEINSVTNFKIIESILQEHSGKTIKIIDSKEGSIKLIVEGSPEDIKRLVSRIKSGELKEVSGFPVEDIQILSESSDDKWRIVQEIVSQAVEGRNLSGADLSDADLCRVILSSADLSGTDLSGADLSGADLSGANLSGANLSGAYLSRANLSSAYLSGANLSHANLSHANLSGANLEKAYIASTIVCCYVNATSKIQVVRISNIPNWYFERVVFPGQRLVFEAPPSESLLEIYTGMMASAILSDTIPCERLCLLEDYSNLSGVNLSGANLDGANLSRADLRHANLSGADLSGANLRGADLSGADLSGANLRGGSLRPAADVKGAQLGSGLGLTDSEKKILKSRGAIFDDSPNDREPAYSPVNR